MVFSVIGIIFSILAFSKQLHNALFGFVMAIYNFVAVYSLYMKIKEGN